MRTIGPEDTALYRHLQPTPKGTARYNLGCGLRHLKEFVNVDHNAANKPDMCFDLCDDRWPINRESIDYACSVNTLEHLPDILPFFGELYRCLKPEAVFECIVPYWLHPASVEDPTHIRQFGPRSMEYFQAGIYGINTRWYSKDRFNFETVFTNLLSKDLPDDLLKAVADVRSQYSKGVSGGRDPHRVVLGWMASTCNLPGLLRYVHFRLRKAEMPAEVEPEITVIDFDRE